MQRGGAVAMIVTNYADEILNMGAYSDVDIESVTIPLVLVMQADGGALRAAVEGGDAVQPEPRAPSPEPRTPPFPSSSSLLLRSSTILATACGRAAGKTV